MNFEKILQKKIGGYLARHTVMRPILKEVISEVITALPDTVIFGGMIREFALGNARKFVSDIDLVSMANQSQISLAVSKYNAVRNKFGGFRFVIEKQRFDIWSLPDTWAFREGFASGSSFTELLKTSFFNIDAAGYHVDRNELLCLPEYSSWIKDRVLDINLAQNPHSINMARRALVLMQTHQLGVTRNLAQYISTHLDHQVVTWTEQLLISKLIEFVASENPAEFRFKPQSEM
jgi:hypothetical protein